MSRCVGVVCLLLIACGVVSAQADFAVTNGLTLRLDASAISGLTNGQAVAAWSDLSGAGQDATQANTANQPAYVTNGINGQAVVRFDGTNDYLDGVAFNLTAQTIFLVAKLEATAVNLSGVFAQKNADANNIRALTPTTWNAPGNGANTADFSYNGTSYVNGHIGYTHGNQFHILANVAATPRAFQYRLSQSRVLGGNHRNFKGDLAEILIYDRVLTQAELGQVGYYLEQKYALTTDYGQVDNAPGASDVMADAATLNGNLNDTDGGQSTVVSVCWGTSNGGGSLGAWDHTNMVGTASEPQTLAMPIAGLQSAQTYYYRFHASNALSGTVWSESTAVFRTDFQTPTGDIALWLSADAIPGLSNGEGVARWPDLSGNGKDAIQDTTGSRPEFVTNVVGGRPVVRNASGKTLVLPNTVSPMDTTLFIVHKQDVAQTLWTLLFGSDLHTTTSTGTFCLTRSGGAFQINSAVSSKQFSANCLRMASGDYELWVDGISIGTSANTLGLTAFSKVGNNFLGDVAEVIVFEGALSASARAEVGLYLEGKYGLSTAYSRVDNANGASDVTQTTATLNGNVNDTDSGAPTVVKVFWGVNDGGTMLGAWEHTNTITTVTSPQAVSCAVAGLAPATFHFYRTYASNAVSGGVWAETTSQFETRFSSVNDGLVLWLDADYFRGRTNGADVSTWQDSSGNGNHATPAAAPRVPKFYDAQIDGSKPVVRFDGTDDYMDGPTANLTAQTIFMVLKMEVDAIGLSGVFARKGADQQNIRTTSATAWRYWPGTANGADFCYGGALYVNGSRTGTHGNQYHILEEVSDDAPSFQYRLSQTQYNRYFKGDLAETIIYNRMLSADERREVGRYLSGKYGIADTAYGQEGLPSAVADPILWYDLGQQPPMTNGAEVARLIDYSGNNSHGTAANPGSGAYITNGVGGRPIVRMDGDDLHYYAFPAKTTIRTVFWVLAEEAGVTSARFLLGHAGGATYHFHRDNSANSYIWSQGWSGLMVNGTTKLDGAVIDGRATKMPTTPAILSVRTSGNATANSFSRDRNTASRNWQGDLAELLIYDRVLSEEEEQAIGFYLAEKYALDTSYAAVANLAATRQTRTSMQLNGALIQATTDDPVTVSVYWGDSDGGTNALAWGTNHVFGAYSEPLVLGLAVTNLAPLTTVFYRFHAQGSTGSTWAVETEACRTSGHSVTNGLQLWLDASAVTNYADGENVPRLRDWSGAGNHALQSVAGAQPVFKHAVTNGQAMIRFDGTNDVLDGLSPVTAKSILIVCRVDPAAQNLTGVFCQENADAQNIRTTSPVWNAPDNIANTADFCFNGSISIDGKPGSMHANRYHLLHEVHAGTPTFRYRLSQPLHNRYFKGDVAEVLIYNRALTIAEQYEIGKYVEERYGWPVDYPVIDVTGVGSVRTTAVTVNGNLAITNAAVTLWYGAVDGGFDTNAWSGGVTATNLGVGDVALTVTGLHPDTTYYARYYATNADIFGWSTNVQVLRASPSLPVTNGVSLWYAASTLAGRTDNERVAVWHDLSGNGRDGTANVNGNPVFVSGAAANGLPVVRFDGGGNTFFTFPQLDDIRTVFWVLREDADVGTPGFLLGSEDIGNIYHFHRDVSPTRYMWNASSSTNVRNGVTMLNGQVVDGMATPVPTNALTIVSLRTTGNCTANALVSDRLSQGVTPPRVWDGDVAELIIYSRELDDEEEAVVGKYLSRRYALKTRYLSGMVLIVR